MVQRFLIELGGSQVDHIGEDEVADALTTLVFQHEHGMGSLHVDVQEIDDDVRVQLMPGYDPIPSDRWMP
jgi:hypothetical protein